MLNLCLVMDISKESLLPQIRVEGIVDADYNKANYYISQIEQMDSLFFYGLYIFDYFKMKPLYVNKKWYDWLCLDNNGDINNCIASVFNCMDKEGILQQYKMLAVYQDFVKQLPIGEEKDWTSFHTLQMRINGCKVVTHCRTKVLERAPDGKIWLEEGIVSPASNQDSNLLVLRNMKTGITWTYNVRMDEWREMKGELLTCNEKMILKLSAQGLSIKEISKVINKSPHTVDAYRKAMFAKLNAHTMIEALSKAMTYQLL